MTCVVERIATNPSLNSRWGFTNTSTVLLPTSRSSQQAGERRSKHQPDKAERVEAAGACICCRSPCVRGVAPYVAVTPWSHPSSPAAAALSEKPAPSRRSMCVKLTKKGNSFRVSPPLSILQEIPSQLRLQQSSVTIVSCFLVSELVK